MNSAEMKLAMFRKIDSLNESDLEKVYKKFIALLSTAEAYNLSGDEEAAINEALKTGKEDKNYTRKEVMKEATQKYPNLNFK
jgi:hypothetical protein